MKTLNEMIEEIKKPKIDENLQLGILVEMEHTHNFPNMNKNEVAEMIAKDHIKQKNDYYIKLIQADLVDEKEAIEFYNNNIKYNNSTEVSVDEV